MDKSLFKAIVDQLSPEMTKPDTRQALVNNALFNSSVLEQIDLAGAGKNFTTQFVTILERYDGEGSDYPLLVAVLETLKESVGSKRKTEIDALIARLSPIETAQPPSKRGRPADGITGGDTMRTYLPYLNTVPLTGRDDDVSKIRAMLGPHATQIIAVGGTGKSRIAAEIVRGALYGAIWHRCSPQSGAYEITDLIRMHYGLDRNVSEADVLAALEGDLPLIVIDNAEDVPARSDRRKAYAALIEQLKQKNVSILLTSRTAWSELKPRREHALQPIPIDPATQLALDFAKADSLTLSEQDARALAEASQRHPRLIEFAVGQLHERLVEKVLRLLRESRHEDIQAMLDEMIRKTVRQMTQEHGADAENLLKRLVVFRGSFDEAALIALAPQEMEADARDDALAILQRWQFVQRLGERYRVEEVVAGAMPADDAAHAAHYAHYRALHGNQITNNNEDLHPQIEVNWPNITAALAWGFDQTSETVVLFVLAVSYYMGLRVPPAEWKMLMEASYTVSQKREDRQGQAHILQELGEIARMQSEYGTAREQYHAARLLYQVVGSRLGQANTLKAIGDVAYMQSEHEEAHTHYEAALPLYQAIESRLGQANTLKALGDVAFVRDNYDEAQTGYEVALRLYQIIGDRLGQAQALQALGDVARILNDYSEARKSYEAARLLFQAVGSRLGQAQILHSLGEVARMQNDYNQARQFYRPALSLSEQTVYLIGQLNTLWSWGLLERQDGNTAEGCRLCRRALDLASSHLFFNTHPAVQKWREQFAEMECEDDTGA